MKRSATAIGVGLVLATPAWAQSSVTIYGIMDLSVRSVRTEGVGTNLDMASGGNAASRLGFRGTEDLGGGLSAGFTLEHGMNADSGTLSGGGAQLWDRRSTVSLVSKTLGELRLGRDYTPTYMSWMRFDPFLYGNAAGSSTLISGSPTGAASGPIRAAFGPLPTGAANPNTTVRSNNTLQYHLPSSLLPGLDGQIMLAPADGTSSAATGTGRLIGARLGYAAGPLLASVGTARSENDLTGGDAFSDSVVAGSYNLGVATLGAAWRQFKFRAAKQTNLLLSGVVSVGNGQIKVSWHQADFSGRVGATNIDNNGAKQLSLGYLHNLSKRTALYAQGSRIDNQGASNYAMPGGTTTGFLAGRKATGFEAGIRHNF